MEFGDPERVRGRKYHLSFSNMFDTAQTSLELAQHRNLERMADSRSGLGCRGVQVDSNPQVPRLAREFK
jgi:hypothetical protein